MGDRDRHVDVAHRRAGGGRDLHTQPLRRLTERGYRQASAGITQQRRPSIHRVLCARNLPGTAGPDDPVGPTISSAVDDGGR